MASFYWKRERYKSKNFPKNLPCFLLIRMKYKMYANCEGYCFPVYLDKRMNEQVKRKNKDLYLFNALSKGSFKKY